MTLQRAAGQKRKFILIVFPPWLTLGLLTWEGQPGWNMAQKEKNCAVHWLLTGDISLLGFHHMRFNEWNPCNRYQGDWKNGHQKSTSLPIYLPLQLSTATALPVFCTNFPPPPFFLESYSLKSLFQSKPPFVSFSPFLLSQPNYPSSSISNTLLLASPYADSHLRVTEALINPGFVLLQKGIGRPSGSTLIAVWEHGPGLLSTWLFSPLLYFSLVMLYSLSHWPSITSASLNAS